MFGDSLELTCNNYYVKFWLNDNKLNGIDAFPYCSYDTVTSDPYELLSDYSSGGGIMGLGNYANPDLTVADLTTSFMWQY